LAAIIHNERWRMLAQKCRNRWFEFKYVEQREALLNAAASGVRFIINHSGRRAYKTETAKRHIALEALQATHGMPYFAADPTIPQARKIWWEDLKLLTFSYAHRKQPNETRLEIYPDNASEIHVIGMDKPERFEGVMWAGGVFDEFDNIKPGMWELHVRPALDSEYPGGYVPWAWLIGVPELGGQLEKLVRRNAGLDDWAVFCWPSWDVLEPDVIETARRELSDRQFRQEYGGEFVKAVGLIYGDYGPENYTSEIIKPYEKLIWTHDQNFTPLSSVINVKRNGMYFALDEIVLESADANNTVTEFVERYRNHDNKSVELHGDPHGRAGEKHGKKSDYAIIENRLRAEGWYVENKVRMAAPAIKDRQNSLRALICNGAGERRLFVNPMKCEWLDEGLSTVKTKEGSTFQEDEANEYHHITTAQGYWAFNEHPVVRDIGRESFDLGW